MGLKEKDEVDDGVSESPCGEGSGESEVTWMLMVMFRSRAGLGRSKRVGDWCLIDDSDGVYDYQPLFLFRSRISIFLGFCCTSTSVP